MDVSNTRKVITTFLYFVIAIGIVSSIITYQKDGIWGNHHALIGLLIGTVSCIGNYLLLHLMVRLLTSKNYVLAVQAYTARMLIYLLAAFLAVKVGTLGAITFSASIIAISVAIFCVYGIERNNK